MRFFSFLVLLTTLSFSPVADAAARLITRATVGPALKTYVIPVRNCAADLTHVRIDVANAPIFVQALGVKLASGQTFSQNQNKVFPVGAGQWTDISPARNLGCITQVFAVARSEGSRAAKISAYGNFQ